MKACREAKADCDPSVAARLGQPVMMGRYAHRAHGIQVDAQDLGHRAELLLNFRIQLDASVCETIQALWPHAVSWTDAARRLTGSSNGRERAQ